MYILILKDYYDVIMILNSTTLLLCALHRCFWTTVGFSRAGGYLITLPTKGMRKKDKITVVGHHTM